MTPGVHPPHDPSPRAYPTTRPSAYSAGNGAQRESPSQLGVAMAPFQLYPLVLGQRQRPFCGGAFVLRRAQHAKNLRWPL